MTDREKSLADLRRAQAEAHQERRRSRTNILAEMGIAGAEAALFNIIHYGMQSDLEHTPEVASRPDYSLTDCVTEAECQVALADCFAKGWLQVIDEIALTEIQADLHENNLLGPIYGLPMIGCVDFTATGANLWQEITRRCFPKPGLAFAYHDTVHIKTTEYRKTKEAVLETVPESDEDFEVNVNGPVRIGPWRVQWWRRFSEGFRVDIEEKMRWQGRGGGGGNHAFLRSPGGDPEQLRHILACENVSPEEWLLLRRMEHSSCRSTSALTKRAAKISESEIGVSFSVEEFQQVLESCFEKGRLRVVDQSALDEILNLLLADPTNLLVPDEVLPQRGNIDFTEAGADLYRRISAEWLGRGWENELSVCNVFYREEHRYCESKDALQGIAEGYSANGENVRASRLLPIGPWCVYWWNRFPSGYRLELEIGELDRRERGVNGSEA